jgi:hypothetical protein
MMDFLTRTKELSGTPSIQPAPSEVVQYIHKVKQTTPITHLARGTSSDLILIAPVGFNAPNPLDFSGIPTNELSPVGIPRIRWTDAPEQGGCK